MIRRAFYISLVEALKNHQSEAFDVINAERNAKGGITVTIQKNANGKKLLSVGYELPLGYIDCRTIFRNLTNSETGDNQRERIGVCQDSLKAVYEIITADLEKL